MPREMKPGPSTPHAQPSSFFSLLSGWVQQGVESFFATQRILVDVAMRQNASLMKRLRDAVSDPEHSPMAILSELAVEGTANFVEAQRILLSLVQQENEIVMNGVKERVGGSTAAMAMTDFWRRSVDNFVEMQQDFLTIANKQMQGWMHAAKAGKPADGNRMVEMAREGMENFVKAQKRFLDIVAEETQFMTSNKPMMAKKGNKTELSKLAHEAATAFIDAQKKLLDLAGQQMNVNLQAASHTMDLLKPFRLPIANMTGEGVKNFVDAEKAMLDSMMKPIMKPHNGAKPAAKAKRPPRPRKVEVAQPARVGV